MASKMMDAFKLKPFDLEPIFAEWTDAPRFLGNSKKDGPVEAWMEQIKAGCIERKVPEESWVHVAQHYMGDLAKERLNEVKKVMAQVQGGSFRWTWKKFNVAMKSMSWKIDSRKKERVKVEQKKSDGGWWVTNWSKEEPKEEAPPRSPLKQKSMSNIFSAALSGTPKKEEVPQPPVPKRANTTFSDAMASAMGTKKLPPTPSRRESHDARSSSPTSMRESRAPSRRNTASSPPRTNSRAPSRRNTASPPPRTNSHAPSRRNTAGSPPPSSSHRPPMRSRSTMRSNSSRSVISVKSPATKASEENADTTVTNVADVPSWLLNACSALDLLTTDHPKVMSTLSAVLITVGSLPAIPAIAGGAGGAILASGAAHAAGAMAVGVGTWIKQQQNAKQATIENGDGPEGGSSLGSK